jgi:SPP1 gp7 family putative phage head morphogenesis protein
MAIFDFLKKRVISVYKPSVYAPKPVNQSKAEVPKKDVKFPAELGEEHPFDFSMCEGTYKKFGFVTGVIDKYVDFVIGNGFFITTENENAKTLIENFMREVNFDTVLRAWCKEALIKGTGFLELGGSKGKPPSGLKVLDGKYIYIKRDKYGNIEGYNQYIGGFNSFAKEKIVGFEEHEIAHISFNKIGSDCYGLGIIYPALNTINNLLQNESDMHMLMERKANAPIHAKCGNENMPVKPSDVTAFGKKMEHLKNTPEWTTDHLIDMKVLDFGNIGEKFDAVLKYDTDMLFFTFQVPEVLMGRGSIPEGLAKVQMEAFERRIQSIQAEIEKVVERDIFKRILNANNLNVHVEFEWGQPNEREINERIDRLTGLLNFRTSISESLRVEVEKDLARQLGYGELEIDPEEERKKEEEETPQPKIPKTSSLKCNCKSCNKPLHESNKEYFDRFKTIKEWLGYDYVGLKNEIDGFLKEHSFEELKAVTKTDLVAGKLSQRQIVVLREVLRDGFDKERMLVEMARDVDKKVKLKDRLVMKDGKIMKTKAGKPMLAIGKDRRSIGIVRSEVTRAASEGAKELYKKNGIKKVAWVAAASERTCPECMDLDGQIFELGQEPMQPLHGLCRCAYSAVTE